MYCLNLKDISISPRMQAHKVVLSWIRCRGIPLPRSTRYLQNGYIYHLTHRCHNGRFMLRFSRERDYYREWLRVGAQRCRVAVLGFTITSNHVHVVLKSPPEVLNTVISSELQRFDRGGPPRRHRVDPMPPRYLRRTDYVLGASGFVRGFFIEQEASPCTSCRSGRYDEA